MSAAELKRRRRRLSVVMQPPAVAVLPAAAEVVRNRDVHYPFRQDSDFQYLTGFPEPEALAVLAPGRKEGEYLLFCRPRDEMKELWEGRRAGLDGAREHYGADDAHPIEEADELLPKLLENCARLYYPLG